MCPCARVPVSPLSRRPLAGPAGSRGGSAAGGAHGGAVADGTGAVPRHCRLPGALAGTRTFPAVAHGEHWEWAAREGQAGGDSLGTNGRRSGVSLPQGTEAVSARCRIQSPAGDSGTGTVTGQRDWIRECRCCPLLCGGPRWQGELLEQLLWLLCASLAAPQHLQHPHPPPRRVPAGFWRGGWVISGAGPGTVVQERG